MTCARLMSEMEWGEAPFMHPLGVLAGITGWGGQSGKLQPPSLIREPPQLPPSVQPPSPNCHFKPGRPASHSQPLSPVWCGPCCPGSRCQVWPWGCMGAGSRRTLLEQGLRFVSPASVSLPSPSLCQGSGGPVAKAFRAQPLLPSVPPSALALHGLEPQAAQLLPGQGQGTTHSQGGQSAGPASSPRGWLTSRARGAP